MSVKARRDRERRARREAILDAGVRVLEAVGYRNLRMEEVAAEAELSKGTLYLYFEGKDALCAGIAERTMGEVMPGILQGVADAPHGLAAVLEMSRRFLSTMVDRPHIVRVAIDWLQTERVDDRSDDFRRYRERVQTVVGAMVQAIIRGQRDGSIRADVDPLHKAMQSWSSSLGVQVFVLHADNVQQRIGQPIDPRKLLGEHLATVARSLAASTVDVEALLSHIRMRAPQAADGGAAEHSLENNIAVAPITGRCPVEKISEND